MSIPPKSLKLQLSRSGIAPGPRIMPTSDKQPNQPRRPVGSAHMPVIPTSDDLAELSAVTTDNLPVLQAFQEFLAAERKSARRQVVAVTSFFLMLFLIIAGAAAFFAYVFFGQMNTEIGFLHSELNRTKSSMKQDTSEMLSELMQRTDALKTRIMNGDAALKVATSQISNSVSNSLSERLSELDPIRKILEDLQQENRILRRDLAQVRSVTAQPPSMAAKPVEASTPSEPLTMLEDADIIPDVPGKSPSVSKPYSPIEIAILPPGSSGTIKWRIPISE